MADPPARPARHPGWARLGLYVLMALVVYQLWLATARPTDADVHVTYTTFLTLIEEGHLNRVTFEAQRVEGTLHGSMTLVSASGDTVVSDAFSTNLPSIEDTELLPLLRERGVEVDVLPDPVPSWRWTLLVNLLPFLLLVGIWILVVRRFRSPGEGFLSIGRSGARVYEHGTETVTFDDVAGASGAKRELREIVEFLDNPERFRRLGAEIPRGVLLTGPPGTGKTLLARAVAGEAAVPFFSITGSDFMEMFVGVGPKRVRDLFESAKEAAPSIIFIDELDAIGGRRGAGVWVGGADERERTLNQLLSEMSGFEPYAHVIVMAATNRPDILDSALLRPGRFDRRVVVELPTQSDREQILALHGAKMPLDIEVDLKAVARGTPGFSGADLKNLLNEAALLAARGEHQKILPDDVEDARDKILMGLEREGLGLTDREVRLLSVHEAGHAILAAVLQHTDPLHKVTIVPRGRAMGVTQQLPLRERYVYEKEYVLDRVTVMMGGRAAEELVLGTSTSGAHDDLSQAISLVRRMVLEWGMSESLGPIVVERPLDPTYTSRGMPPQWREYSEATAQRIDEAIEQIVGDCYRRALAALTEHRQALERVAARLEAAEELTGAEVTALIANDTKAQTEPVLDP